MLVQGVLTMKVTVKYRDKILDKELEVSFYKYDWFGYWYANTYEYINVIEVIQEE